MRLRNGLLAVLVAAAFPASAVAAPDKTAELSADTPTFAWEGEGTGIPISAVGQELPENPHGCDAPGHDCDYVLLDVKHPGVVKVTVGADDAEETAIPIYGNFTVPDLDVYFYASDKDGTPQGESLTGIECAGGNAVETCEAKGLAPGLYVVEVSFFLADAATYKGEVALTTPVAPTPPAAPAAEAPAPPPAPAAEPPAPAAPQESAAPAQPYVADEPKPAAKKPSKKAACQKKAKKVKNKGKRKKALRRCGRVR